MPGFRQTCFLTASTLRRDRFVAFVAAAGLLPALSLVFDPPTANAQDQDSSATVQLKFPANLELRILIDYVADRLGMNILYGDEVGRARVTIKSPAEVPVDSLPGVLESALRMNGLTLIDSEQPGWKRIVPVQAMAAMTRRIDEAVEADAELPGAVSLSGGAVVTQVIKLEHADPTRMEAVLRPFLTPQGANLIVDAERRLLIVTDFRSQVHFVEQLIERLDRPAEPSTVAFVEVQHMPAARLAQGLTQVHTARQRLSGAGSGSASRGVVGDTSLEITADDRLNRLILVGQTAAVAWAEQMASELDADLGLETRVYPLAHAAPDRLDGLVRRLIDPLAMDRLYIATVDQDAGFLVASATPGIHQTIAELAEQLDVPLTEAANPVRFYKLQNADAAEVLATIRAIEGAAGLEGIDVSPPGPPEGSAAAVSPAASGLIDGPPSSPYTSLFASVEGREATVTADENLNSIIVVAEPAVQRVYETLIEQLDRRRPQVMIEATIVTLDTTNGFTLGVEVSVGDFEDGTQTFAFSQFGLSQVTDTGRLDLLPGVGFNGAVLQADVADVVLQALKTSGRTSVVSAPKILVNDNATGTIASVAEAPVASINQGQNTDTVTFSGFVEAGTTISVTPQIAEGEHLRLEFEVALESFTGDGSTTLPPPRSSNTVSSEVTIPDGATIVVGGINRKDVTETVSRIPVLGEIPVLEYLFSSRSSSESESTLFVFLRPVILRDDRFADLKFYSARDVEEAGSTADYPSSEPMLVR